MNRRIHDGGQPPVPMKRHSVLVLSLAVNALLLCFVLRTASRRTDPAPAQSGPAADSPGAIAKADASLLPKPSRSFNQWIRQSRDAGIADDVLVELVVAEFNNRWAERQREFDRRYWRGYEDNASRARFEQEHDVEVERAVRSALGDKSFFAWDKRRVFTAFDVAKLNLSPDEEKTFYQIQKEWNRLNSELQGKHMAGEVDEGAFNQSFSAGLSNYESQCKALLGDDRYAALQQPMDMSNVELRQSLGKLPVTEAQFDALVAANQQTTARRAELDRQLAAGELQPTEYTAQLQAAELAKEQAFQQTLGAETYADVQKQQDSRYEMLKQYAVDWKLSANDVEYLYRLTHDYAKSVQDYRQHAQMVEEQGQAVDWQTVQQNLHRFSQQTEQVLRVYLGDDRLTKLKENRVFEPDN
jgi:hypothetical protein